MKTGRSLQELATEVRRQSESKRDFIAPVANVNIGFVDIEGIIEETQKKQKELAIGMMIDEMVQTFQIKEMAHQQIASHLQIPKVYYNRMMEESPELLVQNVNHWFGKDPSRRMFRTLDGRVRAFLSDRFRPLDNFDLAQAVLPILANKGLDIKSCEITDRKLYLKATRPDLKAEIKGSKQVGDVVEAGIVISNSEVGCGSLAVQPMIYRLLCLNGMISSDYSLRKYHTGARKGSDLDISYELLSDRTKEAKDTALWMEVQDLVKGALEGVVFDRQVKAIEATVGNKIEGNPEKSIEVTQKKFGLSEKEKGDVLKYLIEGGDLSQWGLCNAVTRASQDSESYDRATDLERVGGEIIEMPQKVWKEISVAA